MVGLIEIRKFSTGIVPYHDISFSSDKSFWGVHLLLVKGVDVLWILNGSVLHVAIVQDQACQNNYDCDCEICQAAEDMNKCTQYA